MRSRFKKDITYEGQGLTLHWDFDHGDPWVFRVTLDDESTEIPFDNEKALDFITADDVRDALDWLTDSR